MDPSVVKLPPTKDLTIDNITDNVHAINSSAPDPRLKYLLERLVTHLHDYARETRLSTSEWMGAINFLTQVGQICSDVRQVCRASGTSIIAMVLARKDPIADRSSLPRNSFCSPTSWASPSSSIRSTTPSRHSPPKAQSSAPSTPTKLNDNPTVG